jgi:hypothetical protein
LQELYRRTGVIGATFFFRTTAETNFDPCFVAGYDNLDEFFLLELKTDGPNLAVDMDNWALNHFRREIFLAYIRSILLTWIVL